ncbi:M14 family metallopeptidase [Pseudoalteromonas phenolica]|uniref:Zinc carboxypeptidase-like protein n=1 Tax=Pseudoalteromonas phenolica TaxID=161398 RepID=A0A0S2K1Z6_9GAMM|nr:M14 family metallocarboxypeptidase [Pseudoalteromonas phenolica]ALO42347.1 Zinc carboxypeptidase-like protein [Pseudoalteromonas phenolica]MBE0356557.1 hypothetical protein [Pseudoalteromonas phenolica O-BC30]RXE96991.1 DUF2817 domain-containing protein [Pseudoalteromonas phenolica O-BC30]TMO54223.1 DUF2817 domain-containing protein [Pseudoalteromonas phenolica]
MTTAYPIGKPGTPWQEADKKQWLAAQVIKRSYQQEVETKILALADEYDVEQYGELNYGENEYKLYAVKSRDFSDNKPTILVTGGVHGYETSGVHGAIEFIKSQGKHYEAEFNIVVLPCISPWGYETINRWNPDAIDPNRSFYADSPAAESKQAMAYVAKFDDLLCHVDLHETTDTDNSEFRPALAARDGVSHDNWNIPDGFYLVGHTQKPQYSFQTAIIKEVEKVTHIAPADEDGRLIGVPIEQFGVINYDGTKLGLCMGMTNAEYVTTTEVYPDSPSANDEICVQGQVASVVGALNYIKSMDD